MYVFIVYFYDIKSRLFIASHLFSGFPQSATASYNTKYSRNWLWGEFSHTPLKLILFHS